MITLIPQTDQEAFDSVWNQLKSQTQRSTENGCCVYRMGKVADAQVRCAIGGMIRDQDYKAEMEGAVVRTLVKDWPISRTLDINLLAELQNAHDTIPHWSVNAATGVETFIAWNELRHIAQRYDLSVPA